jgi:hypothetical protein
VDRAVRAARAAQPRWAAVAPQRRARALLELRQRLDGAHEELAALVTRDMGKGLDQARAEVGRGIESVEAACAVPHLLKGESLDGVAAGVDVADLDVLAAVRDQQRSGRAGRLQARLDDDPHELIRVVSRLERRADAREGVAQSRALGLQLLEPGLELVRHRVEGVPELRELVAATNANALAEASRATAFVASTSPRSDWTIARPSSHATTATTISAPIRKRRRWSCVEWLAVSISFCGLSTATRGPPSSSDPATSER